MKPQCIITGCDMVIRGVVYHGDLHRLGSTLIFNAVVDGEGGACFHRGRPSAKFVEPRDWFERRGVFVFIESVMSEAAHAYITGAPAHGGLDLSPDYRVVGDET